MSTAETRDSDHYYRIGEASFAAIWEGRKRAILTTADDAPKEGDVLSLWETTEAGYRDLGAVLPFAPEHRTRRSMIAIVTHATVPGDFGMPDGYALLSLEVALRYANGVPVDAEGGAL